MSEAAVENGTRTEEVMRIIRQRIERRALTPGARLPSVRAMAESTVFSKSTVVEAYDLPDGDCPPEMPATDQTE